VLKGEVKDILLLDRDPLSLASRPRGGIFTKADRAEHHDPHQEVEIFTTADDNQPSVQIQVYQGTSARSRRTTRSLACST